MLMVAFIHGSRTVLLCISVICEIVCPSATEYKEYSCMRRVDIRFLLSWYIADKVCNFIISVLPEGFQCFSVFFYT